MKLKNTILILTVCLMYANGYSQRVPNESESIDYMITFGKDAPSSTGDDDHVQIFFFIIPKAYDQPFYVRVYDPDTGGNHDELKSAYNTKCKFTLFGGEGAFSNEDARKTNPVANMKSGNIVASKIFGSEEDYDSKWYTFGPFNPAEGEFSEEVKGRVFKIITEGLSGDDGNAYRLFLSVDAKKNVPVEGANAFTYEYTFRLPLTKGVSHLYPFIDKSVISITQYNFDFDNDGEILIYSVAKNRHESETSGDNIWASGKHEIKDSEKNTTLDLQIFKKDDAQNSVSVYVTNQYNQAVAFFSVPIGGPPKFKYDPIIGIKKAEKR
jgi:hypothetical protein